MTFIQVPLIRVIPLGVRFMSHTRYCNERIWPRLS